MGPLYGVGTAALAGRADDATQGSESAASGTRAVAARPGRRRLADEAGEGSGAGGQSPPADGSVRSEGLAGARVSAGSAANSAVTIANGATVEIAGPSAQSVTFAGTTGTLRLEDPQAFTGVISGLTGADAIDLSSLAYGANVEATYSGDATGGTLTVSDGTKTARIALSGNYLSSTWTVSSDGKGGTSVVDPTLPAGVTLQQIDGGPTYYASNGFTYAANAGWDNPSFIPIGPWEDMLVTAIGRQSMARSWLEPGRYDHREQQSVDRRRQQDMGYSERWRAGPLPGTGAETVGLLAYDEPSTYAEMVTRRSPRRRTASRTGGSGESTIPGISSLWRILMVRLPRHFGGCVWMRSITTPNGTTRHIDASSIDVYWFAGAHTGFWQYAGGLLDNLGQHDDGRSDGSRQQLWRRHFRRTRLSLADTTPILGIVEDGGPYTTRHIGVGLHHASRTELGGLVRTHSRRERRRLFQSHVRWSCGIRR